MAAILKSLPAVSHPDILVGTDTFDDAGVVRLTDDIALVQTVDFFPPVVQDPHAYGRIGAANSLSDVWAMGGQPKTVLNVLGYPRKAILPETIAEVLRGAAEKVIEAGALTVGGHTMEQEEVFFGLSVTGIVHPKRIWSNAGARAGDRVIVTKPLGSGCLTTALKKDALPDDAYAEVVAVMERLNKYAAEACATFDVSAVTDITGYGLMGHAREMADGGGRVTVVLNASAIPIIPAAIEFARKGFVSGGAGRNRSFMEGKVAVADGLDAGIVDNCFDAQTSGGLLIAVAPNQADDLVAAIQNNGDATAALVGEVIAREGGMSVRLN